jgi:hypothetical protein
MLGPSAQLLPSPRAGVLGRFSTHTSEAESLGLEDGVDHVALTYIGADSLVTLGSSMIAPSGHNRSASGS